MNLQNIGLVELNAQEIISIEGGNVWEHIAAFVKGFLEAIL